MQQLQQFHMSLIFAMYTRTHIHKYTYTRTHVHYTRTQHLQNYAVERVRGISLMRSPMNTKNAYEYIHIHIYKCTYINVHTHIYIYINIHVYTYTYIYVYVHVYIYVYTYVYVHVSMHIYIYIRHRDSGCDFPKKISVHPKKIHP